MGEANGPTWTHDIPPGDIDALLERLSRCDGVTSDSTVIVWRQCQALVEWARRLRSVAGERSVAHGVLSDEPPSGDDLVDRLRGIYLWPDDPPGGERRFKSSLINREAADRIEELEALLREAQPRP